MLSIAYIRPQIKNNIVAIISLVTALSGFFYNSWRDSQNELNQNMRNAAFEILEDLGELQTIVNYAHYNADISRGSPIEGWKYAVQIRDLSRLLNKSSAEKGLALYLTWEQDWPLLDAEASSEQRISLAILQARKAVLNSIDELN